LGAQKKKILKRNLSYKPIKRRSLKVKIKNKKIKSKILSLTLRKPIIVENSGLNDSVEKMKAASQVALMFQKCYQHYTVMESVL